ncbi:UNKNOWN [Stylonychia lemnae]|uniref:Uncharacterized protein n=1 Tax=Stylonychia lemnae TaxID=5949 RepID=A0A078AIM2_STYLE|nr:UNKNOWN [Stylonychia lemnae]|eukprot:CDW82069.1 UNKNOWN [Stylonychia lemnae]
MNFSLTKGKTLKGDQIENFQRIRRGNTKRFEQLQDQFFDNLSENRDSKLQIDIMNQDESDCNLIYRNQDLDEGDINLNNMAQEDESSHVKENSEQISGNDMDIQQFDDELEKQIQLESIDSEIGGREMVIGINKIEEQLIENWDDQFEHNDIHIKKQSQPIDKSKIVEEDLLLNQRSQSQNEILINTEE